MPSVSAPYQKEGKSDKVTDKLLLMPRDLTLSHRLATVVFLSYVHVLRKPMTNTDGGQII